MLTGATASGSTITYTFSEPLTQVQASGAGFGYYTESATTPNEITGTGVTTFAPGSSTVTVTFPAAVAGPSRYVVDEGTVFDANGSSNPAVAFGGPSEHPNLTNTGGRVSSQEASAALTHSARAQGC